MSREVESVVGEYYKKVPRYLAIVAIEDDDNFWVVDWVGEECSTEGCLNSVEYYRVWYDENDNEVDVDDETWFCKDCAKLYLERNCVKRTTAEMNANRPIYIPNRYSFSRKE